MIVISGYDILAQLYESANSEVYRAIRATDGQKVILKVLKQDYPTPAELTRYKQEYELTRSLDQDGVLKVYGLEKYHNTLVMIIEDFGGESLKILRENYQFSLSEFLSIAMKIATKLGEIHAANIIHKDINPANIVLHPETGELKIIDFGISTRLTRENPTLKNPNVLEGTLAYISPEQTGRMNRSLDYRTDFYSLGVTFYELLTGKLPFDTDDDLELVHCHIAKQPLLPSEVDPKIPLILAKIIDKMMAKNAEDRYQTAYGLQTDLEECLKQLENQGFIENFPLGRYDISDKFQLPQKLYGRDKEIEILLTAFDRVISNKSELMLIGGYSGIGKSALVQEVYKPITAKRGYFIKGKFDQFQRNIPYSAVVNALRELIKQLLTETEAQLKKWQDKLAKYLGVNGQIIIDVIPELELIIGKQSPLPELGPNETQNRFNFVFQNFIKVFTQPEHPLVLFLDDLQWADGASLKLMQLLMSDTSIGLFLIGAYRDNEVSPTHPLILTLEELEKTGAVIEQIFLSPLEIQNATQLIGDAVKSSSKKVKSLAELVLLKTGGNPFFLNEFIKALYTEGMLNFEQTSLSWHWNLNQIKARDFTDNVVELMTGKIQKLPLHTQNILKIGAAIGNEFDLGMISAFQSTSLRDIVNSLDPAVSENLVIPLDTRENIELSLLESVNYQLPDYKFIHDRVQQAAYTMIPELEQKETHLKIGRLLLANTPSNLIEDKIFDIVNQLNQAHNIIDNPLEKTNLAQLNLIAGRKAKASIAYELAVQYLSLGLEFLGNNSWENYYELTLGIYEAAAEASYLNGDFETMEKMIEIVLQNAKTILEKVKIYEVKMLAYITRTKLLDAAQIGLQILKLLGINLPESPTQEEIQQVFVETKTLLQDKSEADLLNLPTLSDPNKLAAMRILSILFGPIFLAKPTLLPFIPCQQIKLFLEYGNNAHSALAYANYAIILNGFLQELDAAYQFGQLALKLLDQVKSAEIHGRTLNQIAAFTIHGKAPLRDTFPLLLDAYQSSLENGDLEVVGYSAMNRCQYLYLGGEELILVEKEMENYCQSLAKFNLQTSLNYNQIFWQSALNFMSPELNNPSYLLGKACNEQQILPMLLEANDRFGLFSLYLHKLILSYLFDEYREALINTIEAEKYVDGATGIFSVPVFYFYDSLARLAIYSSLGNEEQELWLQKIKNNQAKMQKWANFAPMNFQHKFDLIEAETARVLGDYLGAIKYYDRAIMGAKENQFIQEDALANELAAQFYLNWGKEKFAQIYIQEAHYSYTHWGATAKVKHLEKKYPLLLTITPVTPRLKTKTTTRTITGINSGSTLDLATVMKASQAISGEIVLDQLLVSLMKIIIQNAGAQWGYLVLENQGELLIEAAGVINDDHVTALQSIPIENNLPVTLINYVARLKEDMVLNDATKEGNFVNDPYIVTHRPKSILCTPLVNQGQLIGIVYLENNLTTGAFTPDRLEVIKLLSGQAAIALENARLYQTLENKVIQRTAQLAAANQEISILNEKLKAENLRLSAELDVAKKLQEMVLPKPAELEVIVGLDIAGYMEPADEVGGDYYDVLSSENGVKIAIGDVTGHGLESGVLMLMTQTAVRTLQKVNETDPVRFLDIINQTLYDNLQRMDSDKNLTLSILDYGDGVAKLSGQHEEMIVVRADGTIEEIDTVNLGFPIGLDSEIANFIDQITVNLNSQDIVILYTDGITEAANMENELYGLEKLCQVVGENRALSAQEIRQKVIDDLREFIGNQKVFDDITLVVLKQK